MAELVIDVLNLDNEDDFEQEPDIDALTPSSVKLYLREIGEYNLL